MTESSRPRYEPVKPKTLRTSQTSRASSRKVSAMYFARSGSPGMRTVGAKSPGSALMCGVAMAFLRRASIASRIQRPRPSPYPIPLPLPLPFPLPPPSLSLARSRYRCLMQRTGSAAVSASDVSRFRNRETGSQHRSLHRVAARRRKDAKETEVIAVGSGDSIFRTCLQTGVLRVFALAAVQAPLLPPRSTPVHAPPARAVAPVCSPSLRTWTPLTKTWTTPVAYWCGSTKVAWSWMVSGSKTTTSAK